MAECGGYQVRMIAPNGLHVDIDQAVYVKPDVGHAMFFDGQSENFVGRYARGGLPRPGQRGGVSYGWFDVKPSLQEI